MKDIRFFYLEVFLFLVVKIPVYLNRRVFVMPRREIEESTRHKRVKVKYLLGRI